MLTWSVRTKFFAAAVFTASVLASEGLAVVAHAEPEVGAESAEAIIDRLRAEGYTVEINWIGGQSTTPLSECSVSAVHNPDRSAPPTPKTSITVYVDVSCPNEPDDSGLIIGPVGPLDPFGIS